MSRAYHLHYCTGMEIRIFCCQRFCDLLLKSTFEQIFNVMQLILVNIKWKYLIQKFHDICLSYYFKAIWSVKINVKSLKNILIVNHNFVVTIGLPYCYLPFKVIFRTNYFHEILWPTWHAKKTKVTTTTSERQSSYNQNNYYFNEV